MNCSECGGMSHITNSRKFKRFIRRRRECLDCGFRWTTEERSLPTKRQAIINKPDHTYIEYDPINDIIG